MLQEILRNQWTWFLATGGLLVFAFVGYLRFASRLQVALHRIQTLSREGLKAIESTIETNLRPSIYVHDSEEMVIRRAAEIIDGASEEAKATDRFIVFYGAASLSVQTTSQERAGSEESPPEEVYSRALETASRNKVQMRRYISLFTVDEIRERSPQIQERYLQWLLRQQAQLATDELYQLVDVVRAPKWGANMARIITKQSMIEITGNGSASVMIVDEEAAKTIRGYARTAVLGDSSSRNPPQAFGLMIGEESTVRFQEYVADIETAVAAITAESTAKET